MKYSCYLTACGLSSVLLLAVSVANAKEFYVAPSGSDDASGTKDQPFRSIQRAADEAGPGDTVYVREGTYRETVRPSASGTSDSPIVFRPFETERVVISGADPIEESWESANGGAFSASANIRYASEINQAPQVFVDGKMFFEARWPNTDLGNLSRPAKATIDQFVSREGVDSPDGVWRWTFKDGALSELPDLKGADIYLQPDADAWSWVKTGVIQQHSGTTLSMDSWGGTGADGSYSTLDVGARYYVFGKATLLDAAGEWFHDGSRLHLIPQDGSAPEPGEVEVKQRDFAFDLSRLSHITIAGFELFATTITTDIDAGSGSRQDGRWQQDIAESSHIIIDGITVMYPSHADNLNGHMMGQWGQNTGIVISGTDHIVRNSVVQFSSGNGITSLGRRHEIHNNLLLDTNYNATEAGCIGDGMQAPGSDQVWHHNTCLRTGRSGLQLRQFKNSDPNNRVARIHHNIIGNYGLQDYDLGAFYAPDTGNFARIDHNVFYLDNPRFFQAGAYWDSSAEDYIFDHNVVWGAWHGIHIKSTNNQAANIIAYHNTVGAAGGGAPMAVWTNKCDGCVFQNNIFRVGVWDNDGLVNQWPKYENNGGRARAIGPNLVWGREPGGHNDEVSGNLHSQDFYEDDPGFIDLAGNNYRLADGSPAINAGETLAGWTIDGVSIPVYGDVPDGNPDVGAFEKGSEWSAGADKDPASFEPGAGNGSDRGENGNGTDNPGDGDPNGAPGDDGADGGRSLSEDGGCACRAAGSPASSWSYAALVLAGLTGLLRLRRRG